MKASWVLQTSYFFQVAISCSLGFYFIFFIWSKVRYSIIKLCISFKFKIIFTKGKIKFITITDICITNACQLHMLQYTRLLHKQHHNRALVFAFAHLRSSESGKWKNESHARHERDECAVWIYWLYKIRNKTWDICRNYGINYKPDTYQW